MGAPVCNVNPASVITVPPARYLPVIPPVSVDNPQSIVQAINTIQQIINMIVNNVPPNNPINPSNPSAPEAPPGLYPPSTITTPVNTVPSTKKTTSNFVVTSVVSSDVTVPITQNTDGSFSVTVKNITGLTLVNPVTGEIWSFNQGA